MLHVCARAWVRACVRVCVYMNMKKIMVGPDKTAIPRQMFELTHTHIHDCTLYMLLYHEAWVSDCVVRCKRLSSPCVYLQ